MDRRARPRRHARAHLGELLLRRRALLLARLPVDGQRRGAELAAAQVAHQHGPLLLEARAEHHRLLAAHLLDGELAADGRERLVGGALLAARRAAAALVHLDAVRRERAPAEAMREGLLVQLLGRRVVLLHRAARTATHGTARHGMARQLARPVAHVLRLDPTRRERPGAARAPHSSSSSRASKSATTGMGTSGGSLCSVCSSGASCGKPRAW